MKDEYIIINKTKWLGVLENNKKPVPHWDGVYTSESQNARVELIEDIISQSLPFIPENIKPLQELIDEGYDPYDSAHHLQVQRMLKVIQEYLSNLKLDI